MKKYNRFFKIILIIVFIIINYYSALFISSIIDKFFSPCDFNKDDKLIVIFIIFEYIIALIIYSLVQRFIYNRYKDNIFKFIDIGYLNAGSFKSLFTVAFSYGIFSNLNALTENSRYIYHKHISKFINRKNNTEKQNKIEDIYENEDEDEGPYEN